MEEQTKPDGICSALDLAIAEIRMKFINRLVENIQTLEGWADQFDCTSEDRTPLMLLEAEAHKISGIAKSVGFDRLGTFAKSAENAINDFMSGGGSITTPEGVLEIVDSMLCEIDVTISTSRATEV
jgi:HPt (histidine-containing phosphotransfer) domain-containing protein